MNQTQLNINAAPVSNTMFPKIRNIIEFIIFFWESEPADFGYCAKVCFVTLVPGEREEFNRIRSVQQVVC